MQLFRVSVPCPFGRARVSNTHAPVGTSTLDSDTKYLAKSTLTRHKQKVNFFNIFWLLSLRYVMLRTLKKYQKNFVQIEKFCTNI